MISFRNAVLATLVYYDALGIPLTAVEVFRNLINAKRLEPNVETVQDSTLHDVMQELEHLTKNGRVREVNGFYVMSDRSENWYVQHNEREKITAQKWKKLLRYAFWFQAVPYVRTLFVSGSLALNNSDVESDFDVLVITRAGRIYTCRLLLSALASFMLARRTRDDATAPDKFCFNHYITLADLTMKHQSMYTAHTYTHLIPIFDLRDMAAKFFRDNIWVNAYVFQAQPSLEFVRRSVHRNKFLQGIARGIEYILDTWVGGWVERAAARYQRRRIGHNPVTHSPHGRITYTDQELEFHPHSIERSIIDTYNANLKRYGITDRSEPDSGLVVS